MKERINLVTVPFDMEMAKRITEGKIPGVIQMVSFYGVNDCRIVCFDKKGPAPIITLRMNELNDFEVFELCKSNGESISEGTKLKIQLRIPELLTYKEGDIIYCQNRDNTCQWISIVKEVWTEGLLGLNEHVAFLLNRKDHKLQFHSYSDNIGFTRKATEEEKQQLIEALQEDNSEESKKILKQFFNIEEDENVTESKQDSECQFQPFDKVLVRDSQQERWRIEFFGFILDDEEFKYRCLYDYHRYCIPYNEKTKHLLGTYENWEETNEELLFHTSGPH